MPEKQNGGNREEVLLESTEAPLTCWSSRE